MLFAVYVGVNVVVLVKLVVGVQAKVSVPVLELVQDPLRLTVCP